MHAICRGAIIPSKAGCPLAWTSPGVGWQGDATRRSRSPHPGAPPARTGRSSARSGGAPARRASLEGPGPDRQAQQAGAGPREAAGRPVAGSGARRQAVDRPDSRPRAPRGDVGDRATRGSRAWWGPLGPSDGRDALGRTATRTLGSDRFGHDGGARAAMPAESSESELRPPRCGRLRRAASPRGWHRTPGAATFLQKRAARPRARTGRADPHRRAPRRRHGPQPGIAHLARRDRVRGRNATIDYRDGLFAVPVRRLWESP